MKGDYYSNKYGCYFVPEEYRNRVVPKTLIEGKVYEPITLEFIRNNVGNGDVIHAGAFIGDFFPAISRSLAAGCELWTYEANPISLEAAKRTIAINRLANVKLNSFGLSNTEKTATMRVYDFAKGEAAAAQARIQKIAQDHDPSGYIDVELKTLDGSYPESRQTSILHLDIEGHELPALKGAVKTINRCRPILIVEGRNKDWSLLEEIALGFRYVRTNDFENNVIFFPLNDEPS